MYVKSVRIATALLLLVTSARAADTSALDQLSREQIEQKLEQANERLEQSVREITELTTRLNGQSGIGFGGPRTLLGINVGGPRSDTADQTTGVRILSVSPGGPADLAGLKANDVIVSFRGKELRGDHRDTPRQQLLALVHDTGADSPVVVEYQHDGKLQKAQIVPKSPRAWMNESEMRKFHELDEKWRGFDSFDDFDSIIPGHDLSGFGSAELLDLSPGLGHYFGTDKGLLVVRAPKDERLELQDGDVILDIDGRRPTSGSHALQILNSYRAGETVRLHIMRQQKRIELPIEIPVDLKAHGAANGPHT